MPPVVPLLRLVLVDQMQVRNMHKRSRLERVIRCVLCHSGRWELAQFVIDKWQQLPRRQWITGIELQHDVCDVGHQTGCNLCPVQFVGPSFGRDYPVQRFKILN